MDVAKPWIPQRYMVVGLTFLSTFVCYVERVGFSLAYSHTANEVGVDQATKGWVLSAFYYGYASSQIPGGWAAQRLGGRRVLLYSFLLWSVTAWMTPTKPKPILGLVVARLLVGASQGFIFPSIHTVLAIWIPPHERSRSVSLTTSGMYFGAAAAMLMLPSLVASHGPAWVFHLVAGMGFTWSLLWMKFSTDPPGGEPYSRMLSARTSDVSDGLEKGLDGKSGRLRGGSGGTAPTWDAPVPGARRGHLELSIGGKGESGEPEKSGDTPKRKGVGGGAGGIPWKALMLSLPVWAIIINNFTFHYALYVLMNWLPTYFDQVLKASLHSVGTSKMMPYLVMFVFSNVGGVLADHLITKRILSVTSTRRLINTVGFVVAAAALLLMPAVRSVTGAVLGSSVALGACAFARAGFAVNHMDIAPRYAGIVMGLSNTAGTIAGVVGVAATGLILEAAQKSGGGPSAGWSLVYATPAFLCLISAAVFCVFSTGERLFD